MTARVQMPEGQSEAWQQYFGLPGQLEAPIVQIGGFVPGQQALFAPVQAFDGLHTSVSLGWRQYG